jgi:hypothetical protein
MRDHLFVILIFLIPMTLGGSGALLMATVAYAEEPETSSSEALSELVFAGAPLTSRVPDSVPIAASPAGSAPGLALSSVSTGPPAVPAEPSRDVRAEASSSADPATQLGPPVAPQVDPDIPVPDPTDLLPSLDPRKWAEDILNAVLNQIGRALLEAMRGFVDWAMGLEGSSLNFITQTPAEGTYESRTVRSLWDFSRALVNGGLAVILMWGGFNLMVKEHTRSPYHEVMELLPRVILAALAANLTLEFVRFLIDANNAFAAAVGQVGLPGYDAATPNQEGIALIFTALAYGVVAVLLAFQMLMRLALIDMLIVLGPVATLLWVLPQTQGFARWWADLLPITVFQQAIQMMVLKLGSALMLELTPGSLSNALLTLLLGIAVCWLTLKVPSLLRSRNSQASFFNIATFVVASRVIGAVSAGRGGGAAVARA